MGQIERIDLNVFVMHPKFVGNDLPCKPSRMRADVGVLGNDADGTIVLDKNARGTNTLTSSQLWLQVKPIP